MIKNEKTLELFDFPNENSGYIYSNLVTLKSNTTLSKSEYSTLNGIRIGYFENSSSKLSNLDEFFKSNNIENIEYISYAYKNANTLIDALKNNEVDAIITNDLLINDNLKILYKFNSLPHYFVTTKGKNKIINELNNAIIKLNENDPKFTLNLYSKYFEDDLDSSMLLTENELEYLKDISSLNAIYVDNFEPLQYYNKTTNEPSGFYIDILKLISKKLNIKLEYIKVNSYEEAYKLVNENKYNLLIGVPGSYKISNEHNILFTKSFINLNLLKVYSKKSLNNLSSNKILAVPNGFDYLDLDKYYEIKYYPTLKDCLIAVEKNEASFTYGNSYTISSSIARDYFTNLTVISNNDLMSISLALSNTSDKILFDILNKAIISISDDTIQNLIYDNTTNINYDVSFKSFFFSNLHLCLAVFLIIFTIIVSLITISIKLKFNNLNKTKELLILKSQQDPLTGIYNRSTGKELINNYFENFNNMVYCFIILDIDYFKEINDTFGHIIGDAVLREFSGLLKEFFNNDDIMFRLGGDEFIVFMKDIEINNYLEFITKKLSKLCNLMDKDLKFNGITQKISISVGATISNEKNSFNKLYEKSDKLLYKVKRNGRNGFEISSK